MAERGRAALAVCAMQGGFPAAWNTAAVLRSSCIHGLFALGRFLCAGFHFDGSSKIQVLFNISTLASTAGLGIDCSVSLGLVLPWLSGAGLSLGLALPCLSGAALLLRTEVFPGEKIVSARGFGVPCSTPCYKLKHLGLNHFLLVLSLIRGGVAGLAAGR